MTETPNRALTAPGDLVGVRPRIRGFAPEDRGASYPHVSATSLRNH
jgi:hypothetical protein